MSVSPINITIEGIDTVQPATAVDSATLDSNYGYPKGTILKASGIEQRFIATNESASELAAAALSKALVKADCEIEDIDCLIAACGTMEQAIPYNGARILAHFTHLTPIQAFDINMTCLSFLKALEMATIMLSSVTYKRIAIVSSEIASVGIDGSDLETAGLFGDGAAAVILSARKQPDISVLQSNFETFTDGIDYCQIHGGGSLNHPSKITGDYNKYGVFEMQGKELFRATNKHIDGFVSRLLAPLNIKITEIDWIVPHQASALALTHMKRKFNLDPDRVIDIIAQYGNQISVSIPTALHHLINTKNIKKNDRVLLIGTSAGLSIGAMVLQW